MKRREFLSAALMAGAASAVSVPFLPSTARAKLYTPRYAPDPRQWRDDEVYVTWIGHATMLIKMFGTTILTDPVFGHKVGPDSLFGTIGPQRFSRPAVSFEHLPKPDIVLLSHAHMDHTDLPSLQAITRRWPGQVRVVSAFNNTDLVGEMMWKSVTELDWQQRETLDSVEITALEVVHNGWRYPWERDRLAGYVYSGRSCNAYLLRSGGASIVFGGDTAFTRSFENIGQAEVDIAIMPIGAYEGFSDVHCNPAEALTMADEMRARYFVPMHCLTFFLGDEDVNEPMRQLRTAHSCHDTEIVISNLGQEFMLL